MNEQFIIEFIRQRMEQLKIEYYHFEEKPFSATKTAATIYLFNELWYLVDLPDNIEIVSDTAYLNTNTTGSLFIDNVPEFTGLVKIKTTNDANIRIKFIRVIIQKR